MPAPMLLGNKASLPGRMHLSKACLRDRGLKDFLEAKD